MTKEEKILHSMITKLEAASHKLLQRAEAHARMVKAFKSILRDKYGWKIDSATIGRWQ